MQAGAILEETPSETTLSLEANIPWETVSLELTVTSPGPDQEICLFHMDCSFCSDDSECSDMKASLIENAFNNQNLTIYGSTIEYQCGAGKRFSISENVTELSQTLSCQWDGSWSPTADLSDCIRKDKATIMIWKRNCVTRTFFPASSCINPPIPPNDTHLVVLYDFANETEIAFGDVVFYQCEEGFFFEEDFFMKNFTIDCQPSGSFIEPGQWKRCLDPNGNSERSHSS